MRGREKLCIIGLGKVYLHHTWTLDANVLWRALKTLRGQSMVV